MWLSNRRRYPRFQLTDPLQGRLQTSDEVMVESHHGGLAAIGPVGVRPFTVVLMKWKTSATSTPARVKVLDTQPVVMDHRLQFRMQLEVLGGEVSAGDRSEGDRSEVDRSEVDRAEYETARPAWAMLIREVPVRLLDFGRGGVLLETMAPLETGVAGQLDIATGDRGVRSDDVRICRTLRLHGSAFICVAGAEFLPSHETGNHTLREVLDEMHQTTRSM